MRAQIVVMTMVSMADVSEVKDYDKNIKGDILIRGLESFNCSDADGEKHVFVLFFMESLRDDRSWETLIKNGILGV